MQKQNSSMHLFIVFQCIFFVWCFIPIENNGSVILYNKVVRPRFLKHQGNVDDAISNIAGAGKLSKNKLTTFICK